MDPIIILGTGLAGYTVAREFRKYDSTTPLLFITRDDGSAYSKPMLSNALAMRKSPQQLVNFDALAMEKQLNATILTNRSVESIDPEQQQVVISVSGNRRSYSQLVLALGAEPRRLALPGSGAGDILSVNDLRGYARFRSALEGCRKVAILGAGLIGCEFANDLAAAGYQVDVIDPAAAPLSRLVPPEVGGAFAESLRQQGVRFHLGCTPVAVERCAEDYHIMLADGGLIETELVVSAIGLAPRMELANAAGIATDCGISTDDQCQTSVRRVYALGDCASFQGRLQPYVLPIMHAARALGATLSGKSTRVAYPVMPVSVKTPALPAVVVAPLDNHREWRMDPPAPQLVRAICRNPANGRTTGFSLMGSEALKEKASLLAEISRTA